LHFINSKSTWIKIEGVIPAPEATHVIAAVVKVAEKAKEE